MAKVAMLQMVADCCRAREFCKCCYFRPLFGRNGREKAPFLPLCFISRAHLGDIQRRVKVALWRLMGRDSSEISLAASRVKSGGLLASDI